MNERDKSENLIPLFQKYQNGQNSFFLSLLKTLKTQLLLGALFQLSGGLTEFFPPILMKMLIQFMENPDEPTWKGYIIAFLMFITSNIVTIFVHQSWDVVYRLQINVRSCLTNAIYSKALKLSNEAKKEFGSGEIMNLVNGDVPKVEGIALNSMKFWAEPMQVSWTSG